MEISSRSYVIGNQGSTHGLFYSNNDVILIISYKRRLISETQYIVPIRYDIHRSPSCLYDKWLFHFIMPLDFNITTFAKDFWDKVILSRTILLRHKLPHLITSLATDEEKKFFEKTTKDAGITVLEENDTTFEFCLPNSSKMYPDLNGFRYAPSVYRPGFSEKLHRDWEKAQRDWEKVLILDPPSSRSASSDEIWFSKVCRK